MERLRHILPILAVAWSLLFVSLAIGGGLYKVILVVLGNIYAAGWIAGLATFGSAAAIVIWTAFEFAYLMDTKEEVLVEKRLAKGKRAEGSGELSLSK